MSTLQTTDYSLFKKHPSNRNIDQPNLRKLIFSIKTHNMLEFRPILVDGKYQIIDGQHRLEAAKALGLPVYYQVKADSTHEDIVLLNANNKPWSTEQYIDYYISRGNVDYEKFKRYSEQVSVPLTTLLRLFHGSGNFEESKGVRTGKLKFFTDAEKMEMDELLRKKEEIVELIRKYILVEPTPVKSKKFQLALLTFVRNPEVDFEVFKKKIALKSESLRVCSSNYGYFCMFRDIYNWKNQNPITL